MCACRNIILLLIFIVKIDGEKLFFENLDRSTSFTCQVPQRRSILATDLSPNPQSKSYTPIYAVLFRCDSGSGCCLQGAQFVCGPDDDGIEDVVLVFHVREKLIDNKWLNSYEHVTAKNHTRCRCQKVNAPR